MQSNHLFLNQLFRVWPDGTVQCTGDGAPYFWMSDDYRVVEAIDESRALEVALHAAWL